MQSFDDWKDKTLTVPSLLLDSQNPRIPNTDSKQGQRELIADLVENDKVYELAKGIVDKGYYPVEALIAIVVNGKHIVLEGNRRLAALKLLLSPDIAPTSSAGKFRNLASRANLAAIKKVRVSVAPSREAAAPVIMSKHTQEQIAKWSTVMQAKFFKNLVDSGLSVDDVAQQYNVLPSRVSDFLQMYQMYCVACSVDVPSSAAPKVANPREYPMTTLERLYKSPLVAQFLGISFDANKELVGSVDPAEFKKAFGKIVADVAAGTTLNSRTANDEEGIKKYLASFGAAKPDLSRKGTFTATDIISQGGKFPGRTKKPPKRKRTGPRPTPPVLIPATVECSVNNQRINNVFNELRKLRVGQFPNAVALMLRSLLEMGLGYYLHRTGHLAKLVAESKLKQPALRDDWNPSLKEMLHYTTREGVGIVANANLLKALRKMLSEKDKLLSVDTLNLFVHNEHFCPTEDDLRKLWQTLEALFQIILVEPEDED